MPKVKPGVYTLQISLDTKTEMGILVSKRAVKIVGGEQAKAK